MRRTRRRAENDRGAAAVEFALLLPVLMLIIFGLIDFGRALNAQITLTQAAREGARLAALDQSNVISRTQAAASGLSNVTVTATVCSVGASQSSDSVVTVSYPYQFVTPIGSIVKLFGGTLSAPTLTATGTEACEG